MTIPVAEPSRAVEPGHLVLAAPPLCRRCDYDLADTDTDRCPECGDPRPRGFARTGIREMTADERTTARKLIRSNRHIGVAIAAYLAIIIITGVLVAGFARTDVPDSLAIAVGAFGLFVVVAPLPYLRSRVNDFRARQSRAGADVDRGVIEILELSIRRAVRIGQPRGPDILIAGREPPHTNDLTTWFLLLEGHADTWVVLSPHMLRAALNDKPTTCNNRLHVERTPRAGVIVSVHFDGEPMSVTGATAHITSQQIVSDLEICHRDHLPRLLKIHGDEPWTGS